MRETCRTGFLALAVATALASDVAPLPRPTSALASGPQITLVWLDPERALPEGFGTVAQEVTRTFKELGVRATWRIGDQDEVVVNHGGMPEVPVVVLPTNPDTRPARSHVMGSVVAAQEPTRCVWIYLAAIRGTLSSPPGGSSGEVRPYLFHLALARVVAHEVVHAIAPHEPHAARGLMRERLDRESLIGLRAIVDSRCARGFYRELLPQAARPESAEVRARASARD